MCVCVFVYMHTCVLVGNTHRVHITTHNNSLCFVLEYT